MRGAVRVAALGAAVLAARAEVCGAGADSACGATDADDESAALLQLRHATSDRAHDGSEKWFWSSGSSASAPAAKTPDPCQRGGCDSAKASVDKQIKRAQQHAKKKEAQRHAQGVDVSETKPLQRALPPKGPGASTSEPPPNIRRTRTHYGFCDCGTGATDVTFWPNDDTSKAVTVPASAVQWVKFEQDAHSISYQCDGMAAVKTSKAKVKANTWFSLQVTPEEPTKDCKQATSRLKFNYWKETDYVSSVPFTTTTDGYACFKIPAMLRTEAGTFIAISEARKPDCSDFANTDLVYKRSTDGGLTWSALQLMVNVSDDDRKNSGVCGKPLVIGNTAPVQLRADDPHHPGRILAPYTRNNYEHWIVHSDDDGVTFTSDRFIPQGQHISGTPDCDRNMSYFGFNVDSLDIWNAGSFVRFVKQLCYHPDPYKEFAYTMKGFWQFLGAGPPGSLQTSSGRVLVPAYHSYIRGIEGDGVLPTSQLYNNFALGHVLISDDGGDNWRMSDKYLYSNGLNENQMVQLKDGSILTNARSLSTGSTQYRLQARSTDNGESWDYSEFTYEVPEPFNGCQGSTTSGADADTVYVANPDPPPATSILQSVANTIGCGGNFTGRRAVTVWKSTDGGRSYPKKVLVDKSLSAQTSLQFHGGKLYMLYEQADREPSTWENYFLQSAIGDMKVLLPSRFVFREVPGI